MLNLWELQGWLYESLFTLVPHRRLAEETAASLGRANGWILDAGCGTGRLSEWAQTEDVVGVDFSETMLKRARKRNPMSYKTDLNEKLPFEESRFGCVVSLNVLYTLPDPQKTLEEFARVLDSGGKLIVVTPTTSRLLPLVGEHLRIATPKELLVSIINLPRLLAWTVNLAIRGMFERHQFTFLETGRLVGMVEAAGLSVVAVERCYAGIDVRITARKDGYGVH